MWSSIVLPLFEDSQAPREKPYWPEAVLTELKHQLARLIRTLLANYFLDWFDFIFVSRLTISLSNFPWIHYLLRCFAHIVCISLLFDEASISLVAVVSTRPIGLH